MTLEELNAQFPKGSTKLARYHDLTSGSGIVLIETDDPTLAIRHVNPWTSMCDATITPVVDDKKALEILPKQWVKHETFKGRGIHFNPSPFLDDSNPQLLFCSNELTDEDSSHTPHSRLDTRVQRHQKE